ncbi:MAG: hypothetical protein JSW69_01355 [Deltaproteobacteria bacterium]|jgi:hypothetical protein|nr:MAG: hypothetical protein JSW69_01355 [Deltaproteobacteria bacterium]
MKHDPQVWFRKLKSHVGNRRASNPIPNRENLSRSQVLQLHIIKGSLLSLLNNLSAALSSQSGFRREVPCIIFTSHDAGLAAASEIKQDRKLPLISLYPDEMSSFLQVFPDTKHKHHIHIWSHFLEDLDNHTPLLTENYPIAEKEKYWLHVEGIMCGPQLGRGTEHLWRWDGNQLKLLKKNFHHWAA